MGKTVSMNFASVLVTITPAVTSFPSIVFAADVFLNEEEFLSEPTPDKDRAKYFASNDGATGQYIDIFARSGKRDISLIDGDEADKLAHMAMANPQPMFDMTFRYQRNDQDATEVRESFHKNCKIYNHPDRVMSNDIILKKFTFHYGDLQFLGPDGNPV